MAIKRVFILGGNGFVGSAFVREAQRRGIAHETVTRDNYDLLKGKSCDLFVNANGNSRKYLADQAPVDEFERSVLSTLKSLVDFRYGAYLFLSTVAVYDRPSVASATREDRPIDPARAMRYGFHKHLAERLVQHYAPRWMILRLGGMMGPNMKKGPLYDLIHGEPLRVSPASRFQFLPTDAVASAAYSLAGRGAFGQIFNVAGRGTIALKDVLPKSRPVKARAGAPREVWNVSTRKVERFVTLPKTADAVRDFVRRQLPGGAA